MWGGIHHPPRWLPALFLDDGEGWRWLIHPREVLWTGQLCWDKHLSSDSGGSWSHLTGFQSLVLGWGKINRMNPSPWCLHVWEGYRVEITWSRSKVVAFPLLSNSVCLIILFLKCFAPLEEEWNGWAEPPGGRKLLLSWEQPSLPGERHFWTARWEEEHKEVAAGRRAVEINSWASRETEAKLPGDKTSRNKTSQDCAEPAVTQKVAELTESQPGSRDLLARAL